MLWRNLKLKYALAQGHYELNRNSKREFHIVCHSNLEGTPAKKKTFKFSSPQAAKKAGRISEKP